jgi:hypothetical protein
MNSELLAKLTTIVWENAGCTMNQATKAATSILATLNGLTITLETPSITITPKRHMTIERTDQPVGEYPEIGII